MAKKILVTGAAGFIGFHVCKKLIREGYEIFGLDNINNYYDVNLKYARLAELGIDRAGAEVWNTISSSSLYPGLRFVRMNVEDREQMPQLFAKEAFDSVIHLAAQAGVRYSLKNPETYIDSNIVGFLTILEGCRHHPVEHLVYASSSSVYGENGKIPFSEEDRVDYPISLYAATKKSNELMAYTYSHLYRIPVSGLRFFTVYGPWGRPDMAPMLFAKAISEDKPIKVFNQGNMSRDFTYIDDIVQGVLITLNNPPDADNDTPFYRLFNIGNGSPVSLMDFIATLETKLGKTAEKIMMDMQPGDVPRTWADTAALEGLGYKSTTSVDEGVEGFVGWWYEKYYKREINRSNVSF